jgi:hypothetical protein
MNITYELFRHRHAEMVLYVVNVDVICANWDGRTIVRDSKKNNKARGLFDLSLHSTNTSIDARCTNRRAYIGKER